MSICRRAGNIPAAAPDGVADSLRELLALKRLSGRLHHELDTKIFHVNLSRLVGEVDGGGLAPMVYEMPEMRF
jgi:hypothetical protein